MRKIYPNRMNRVCKQFDVWRESIKLESFCVKWNEFGKQNCENTYDVWVAVWSKVLLVNYARKLVHIINCMVRLILREEKTHQYQTLCVQWCVVLELYFHRFALFHDLKYKYLLTQNKRHIMIQFRSFSSFFI